MRCAPLGLALLAAQALALEGTLPADVTQRNDSHLWSITYTNAKASQLAQEITNWKVLTVTVAAELSGVAVPEFKHDRRTALAIAEDLAAKLGAKAWAHNGAVLISKTGPAGAAPGGAPPDPAKPPDNNPPANPPANPPVPPVAQPPAPAPAPAGLTWTQSNAFSCRAARKPIVLYIYDPKVLAGAAPRGIYTQLFGHADAIAALAGFTCIEIDLQSKAWDKAYTTRAKGGAALFFLACDASAVAAFDARTGPPTLSTLQAAATRTQEANAIVVERLKKEDQARNAAAGAKEEEEKKQTPGGIPGLAGDDPGKKEEPKKPEGPKLEDE